MEFEFGILGELDLSGDEHPSSQIAAQACELELQKQKECSFGEWERDSADHLKCLLGNIVCELQPSELDSTVRLDIISRLSMLLNSSDTLRGAKISPFGSFESNFYTEWADLDLSLEVPKESELPETIGKSQKVKILKSFRKVLMKQAEVYKVQFIPYARVPLLTFEDPHYNISCDVSVDNGVARFKSRLLRWISSMDSRCRDLIFLVKCWAKAHCINDPKTGTLNSFALCLLVIFHLQTRSPPVLPPLNAVLHEDIARKFSGRSSEIWREQHSYWERIQSFITNKFGAQNRSSVAELFVSFICQFSSVSELWLDGLVACPFTGKWGDTISTCTQWRSKHYAMAIEDPFDRLENCARSVQEYSFPGVIRAFSSTAEAFKHLSLQLDSRSLLETLFCWPVGLQKQGIRMWLSKVHSREGKVAQVHFPKRFLAEGSSSKKVVSCQSNRPMQTVDTYPQRNGINIRDRGINIINQSRQKKDLAIPLNPHSCTVKNQFENQGNEQLIASKGKLSQRVRTRKTKELQAGGKGMQPVFSEMSHISGKEMQTFEGKHGTGQGNACRHLDNTSNHSCAKGNTKFYISKGPKENEAVSSERKGRVSNNLAQGNAEGADRGHGKPAAQRGWEKPAEQSSRAKTWTQMMAKNEESKHLVVDEQDSVHILTGVSDHTTPVEDLESMRVSDFQSRHKFDRWKYHKNKGFGEQIWRPKCQD